MKKFKVTVVMSTALTCEIEAETKEQAWDIAYMTDGDMFTEIPFSDSWNIDDVQEVKSE